MKVTWMGHSAFLVEASDETRIVIDPYVSGSFGGKIAYDPVNEAADTVLISHDHPDHNGADSIPGNPDIQMQPLSTRAGTVQVTGVPVYHDGSGGSERGDNTILVLQDKDLRLVHLGDLGHELGPETADAIGRVDVLLIPIGGTFTIDPPTAARIVESLSPRIVIPMHYKTPRCGFDLATVDDFTETQSNVERPRTSSITVDTGSLPAERTTIVLEHAR